MKKYLKFILIILPVLFCAQNKAGVRLEKAWKTSGIFKGKIAGKPITLYLEYAAHSGWHDKVYAVRGYYWYDAFKEKIPLAGFYSGDLQLYNFGKAHPEMSKRVLSAELFCWTEPCPVYNNATEYISISQSDGKQQKGILQVKGKNFNVTVHNKSLEITPRDEWLVLRNGKKFNLNEIIDAYGGNSVVSSYEDAKENRILLQYERDSNFNKQGFCGASPPEKGFRLLTFDKRWNIKSLIVYSLSSCLADAQFRGEKKTGHKGIKAYYVSHNDALNLFVVNLRNSTLISKKIVSPFDPYASPFKAVSAK